MATRKKESKQKADQRALRKANSTALKGFPKSKLKAAFDTMATLDADANAARESKGAAGLDIVNMAHAFADKNAGIDVSTIVEGWRENVKLITMELAVAGNRFAELIPAKDDKPARAKLTGYGNNVASIARGVIEYEIDPSTTAKDDEQPTYRSVRDAVQYARDEARRAANPDIAALEDAKGACVEAWNALRDEAYQGNNLDLINLLTETLNQARHDLIEAKAHDDAAEAEAEAELAEAA